MSAQGDPPVIQRLREVLDAVLVPLDFLAGQGGSGSSSAEVVWCTSYDGFLARWPDLPPSGEQEAGSTACVDVVVRADRDQRGRWRLGMAALEGHDLSEVLSTVDDEPAAAVAGSLIGLPLERAIDPLRDLLTTCLARGSQALSEHGRVGRPASEVSRRSGTAEDA